VCMRRGNAQSGGASSSHGEAHIPHIGARVNISKGKAHFLSCFPAFPKKIQSRLKVFELEIK